MYRYALLITLLAVAACDTQSTDQAGAATAPDPTPSATAAANKAPSKTKAMASADQIAAVLAAQPAEVQARYQWRHPQETMEFFGLEPGMTVVEGLPGGGWYSKILVDVLGPDGRLVGADYALDMYPLFGFFSAEVLEEKKTWVTDWPAQADEWRSDSSAPVSAFAFGSMPSAVAGSADAVVFIRALHNLARFDDQGGYFGSALSDAFQALKSGGVLGVVQHEASAAMPDESTTGSQGYLRRDALIARIEAAGFKLEASSDINANPADQPGAEDIVWRLPPSFATSREDPELRAKLEAIGESNRMTLRFRKP